MKKAFILLILGLLLIDSLGMKIKLDTDTQNTEEEDNAAPPAIR